MTSWLRLAGAVAIVAAFGAASVAEAQTTNQQAPPRHRQAKNKTTSDKGRQITVRKSNSYLTLGGAAGPAVTSPNNYVLDTFSAPSPDVGTFANWRGRETMLNNRYDGPGVPLFRFW